MRQLFKVDFMVNWTRGHHVLDDEILKLDLLLHNFLNCLGVVLSSLETLILTLSSCDNHFTSFENEGRGSHRFLHSHDYSCESLRVVLSVSAFQSDVFKLKLLIQFSSGDQILQNWRLQLRLLGSGVRLGSSSGSCSRVVLLNRLWLSILILVLLSLHLSFHIHILLLLLVLLFVLNQREHFSFLLRC